MRLVWILASSLLVIALSSAIAMAMWRDFFLEQAATPLRSSPKTACHGAWLGHTWMEDPYASAEIDGLLARLKENSIGCVYIHTTPLTSTGGLDYSRLDEAKAFMERLHQKAPEITAYAWMGMINIEHQGGDTIGPDVDLQDYLWMQQAKLSALELVDDFGFDGVQINLEPLRSGDLAYLTFLAGLEAALDSRQKPLSVAALFAREPEEHLSSEERALLPSNDNRYLWSWLPEYYQDVAVFADQVVIMAYNKGMTTESAYADWIANQLQSIAPYVASQADLILGIPSYTPFAGETIPAAFAGVQAFDGSDIYLDGMAIYAEWTTDEVEWATWRRGLNAYQGESP